MVAYQVNREKISQEQGRLEEKAETAKLIRGMNTGIETALEELKNLLRKSTSVEELAQEPIIGYIQKIDTQIKQIEFRGGYCLKKIKFQNILENYGLT